MKTTADFIKMKKENEKIAMLTAYDYPSGKLARRSWGRYHSSRRFAWNGRSWL